MHNCFSVLCHFDNAQLHVFQGVVLEITEHSHVLVMRHRSSVIFIPMFIPTWYIPGELQITLILHAESFVNTVNTHWYVTGDERCGQVSSELCSWFLRRKQIPLLWDNLPIHVHRRQFFF